MLGILLDYQYLMPPQIGFCTLYNYYAYPDKTRVRVSQILVLPPYQRQVLYNTTCMCRMPLACKYFLESYTSLLCIYHAGCRQAPAALGVPASGHTSGSRRDGAVLTGNVFLCLAQIVMAPKLMTACF